MFGHYFPARDWEKIQDFKTPFVNKGRTNENKNFIFIGFPRKIDNDFHESPAVNKTGSDRIGLVSSLLVQNYYSEKSCFNNDRGGSE